jgi:hypothetical protein
LSFSSIRLWVYDTNHWELTTFDQINATEFLKCVDGGLFAHPWPDASFDTNAALKTRFLLVIGAVPLNVIPDYDAAAQELYQKVNS